MSSTSGSSSGLERTGYRPKHLAIADSVRDEIYGGKLKAGQFLMTELELAEHYGVSNKTVSKAMGILVSEGLIERTPRRGSVVLGSGKGRDRLSRGRSVCLFMLTEEEVYGDITSKITSLLLAGKYYPVTINNSIYDGPPQGVEDFLRTIWDDRPYGMIIDGISTKLPCSFIAENRSRAGKIVFVNNVPCSDFLGDFSCVLVDYVEAGRMAAREFKRKGCRTVNFFTVPEPLAITKDSSNQKGILEGFREESIALGLEFREEVSWRLMSGEPLEEVLNVLERTASLPTGIIAYPDFNAVENVIPAMRKRGFSRDKYSLIGFFNTRLAKEYKLDSFSINEEELARLSVKALLDSGTEAQKLFVVPELIQRS